MSLVVEGNSCPGNRLTGDDLPVPVYCPVCGRKLDDLWSWTTVDGATAYPWIVCYGRMPRWLRRLHIRVTQPGGAHYGYQLPTETPAHGKRPFDRMTGERLGEG